MKLTSKIPADHLGLLYKIGKIADEKGLATYLVGGYVRDLLLGRPTKDMDVVCVGSGIELADALKQSTGDQAVLTVYKNFGTAAVRVQGVELEFVGARKESYHRDSRKPIVEEGTIGDDQNRRDFTINALGISLNETTFGELTDPFNGVADLERKMIKTPLDPEVTFSDDPLRIMRAVRFASQLQFDIDPDTFYAISQMKERLSIISGERTIDELNKIVLSSVPSYGFKLLFSSGVLKEIFPEMVALQGVKTKDGKKHKDNFYHTLQVLDNVAVVSDNLWLRWAAIMHDIAKPATQRYSTKAGWTFHGHEDLGARWVPKIFRRLKLPMNHNMEFVKKLVRLHLRPISLVNEKVTDSAIRRLLYEVGDHVDELMMLCKADITSKNHIKVKQYIANFEKVEEKIVAVEERDNIRNFQLPIDGEMIMKTFSIKPSKIIGELKSEIKDAVLDGIIPNEKEAAFQFLLKIAKEKGLKPVENQKFL